MPPMLGTPGIMSLSPLFVFYASLVGEAPASSSTAGGSTATSEATLPSLSTSTAEGEVD